MNPWIIAGGVIAFGCPGLVILLWGRRPAALPIILFCGICMCLLAEYGNITGMRGPQPEMTLTFFISLGIYVLAFVRIMRKRHHSASSSPQKGGDLAELGARIMGRPTSPSPPASGPTPEAPDRSGSAGAGRPPTDGTS
jgi:hypothetical protein